MVLPRAHVLKVLSIECIVRGYHSYKDVWNPTIEEQFNLRLDEFNMYDR